MVKTFPSPGRSPQVKQRREQDIIYNDESGGLVPFLELTQPGTGPSNEVGGRDIFSPPVPFLRRRTSQSLELGSRLLSSGAPRGIRRGRIRGGNKQGGSKHMRAGINAFMQALLCFDPDLCSRSLVKKPTGSFLFFNSVQRANSGRHGPSSVRSYAVVNSLSDLLLYDF